MIMMITLRHLLARILGEDVGKLKNEKETFPKLAERFSEKELLESIGILHLSVKGNRRSYGTQYLRFSRLQQFLCRLRKGI